MIKNAFGGPFQFKKMMQYWTDSFCSISLGLFVCVFKKHNKSTESLERCRICVYIFYYIYIFTFFVRSRMFIIFIYWQTETQELPGLGLTGEIAGKTFRFIIYFQVYFAIQLKYCWTKKEPWPGSVLVQHFPQWSKLEDEKGLESRAKVFFCLTGKQM